MLLLAQITYLQVGASAVTGAWGSTPLKSDAIRVGALFRQEIQPLLQAAAAGQFTQQDIEVAPQLLADVTMQQGRGNWDAPLTAAAKHGDQGGMDVEPDGRDEGGYHF